MNTTTSANLSEARREARRADTVTLLASSALVFAFCESTDPRRRAALLRAKARLDKARAHIAAAETILARLS